MSIFHFSFSPDSRRRSRWLDSQEHHGPRPMSLGGMMPWVVATRHIISLARLRPHLRLSQPSQQEGSPRTCWIPATPRQNGPLGSTGIQDMGLPSSASLQRNHDVGQFFFSSWQAGYS